MDEIESEDTLEVRGFTPYAQVPRWVIRSGKALSHGAVRLYGAIMTYADNERHNAFPGREKLAGDLGVSIRSISTYIGELEAFGALTVTRRRNKRTGNFYSNNYVLSFEDPCAEYFPRRDEADCPVTKPTVVTTLTSFTSNESDNGCTPKQSPGATNPGDLTGSQRQSLRHALQATGKLLKSGHKWHSDVTQDQWWKFIELIEQAFGDSPYADQFADLLDNGKWTVSAKVASPYQAGVELNKIIHTALAQ